MADERFLLAYFRSEEEPDGEQVRFAVSAPEAPVEWRPLRGGAPMLASAVGERGVRDPFILRDERRGRFVVLATDLRVGVDGDWPRATRRGSRGIVIWESADLTSWGEPRLAPIAPPEAGNAWAPKAFWSEERARWLVFWASALYAADDDRAAGTHQRILMSETSDFRTFGDAEVYLDLGHDVIDVTFLEDGRRWYRFSANAHTPGGSPDLGNHLFEEVGTALLDPSFRPLAIDIGRDVLARAEGPAVCSHPSGRQHYLLADEFGLTGYNLFRTDDLTTGSWEHVPDAQLPPGARHGSILALTSHEAERLLIADGRA